MRAQTGIELSPGVAGPGLHLSHGKVVISAIAKIGNNCKILSDVTIGGQGRYDRHGAPQIGDRVFIGSGAKIIGNINIAGDCVIGCQRRCHEKHHRAWHDVGRKSLAEGERHGILPLSASRMSALHNIYYKHSTIAVLYFSVRSGTTTHTTSYYKHSAIHL